ncbi:calcium-binding protein [Cavenderia fasciculata]|uniref:Calcium-binding protein n=1 Tax=Cavenderia fasciculata TaxID=261658 RepID=F4PZM0_CACFS|nr:calcium-binding protein [Cavenderia fasciculata]EGG18784.1 calcium-binding protein [Cavenderia fasciculata]|eukprot:XP_004357246.1 calcium-binding protein [Cavenderia fasciculata]
MSQSKDIQFLLDRYDQNKDGKITYAEVFNCLKEGGSDKPFMAANQIFFELDKNHNGTVDIKELSKHTNYGNTQYLDQTQKEIDEFLSKYDKDGDQMISYQEVLEHFQREKVKNPSYLTEKLFFAVDKNKSGVINLKELRQFKAKSMGLGNK